MKSRNIFLTGVKSETNIIQFLFTTLIVYMVYFFIISIPLAYYVNSDFEQKFYSAIIATIAILIHVYYEIVN